MSGTGIPCVHKEGVCFDMAQAPRGSVAKGPRNVVACGTGTTMVLSSEGAIWSTGLNHHLHLGFANAPKHCDKNCWACVKALSREYFQALHGEKSPNVPRFRSVHTCGSSTFAMTPDYRLFSWGMNAHGQLAQGDTDATSLPGRVMFLCTAGTQEICLMPPIWQVACGNRHTVALTHDGMVLTCGDNSRGQLGRRDVPLSHSITRFVVMHPATDTQLSLSCHEKIQSIASGAHTCGMIRQDRRLYMWGCNVHSQVPGADRSKMLPQTTPIRVQQDRDSGDNATFAVECVSIGHEHCACITTDHRIWTWGMNTYGKLGNGTRNGSSSDPFCVTRPSNMMDMPVQVCCGGHHTMVLTEEGSVWVAGSFELGLGIDGGHDACACHLKHIVLPFFAVDGKGGGPTRVLAIAAGKTHSALITADNAVMTCGKMKLQIPPPETLPHTAHDLVASSPYTGFAGLGYFQGMAQNGHVNTFQRVHQLRNAIGFYRSLSTCTLAKVQTFLVGVHLDTKTRATHSPDRVSMNRLSVEVLDLVIEQLLMS